MGRRCKNPQRVDWIREKAPNADRVSFWLRTEAIGTEGALWFLLDVIFTPVGNKFRGWTGKQDTREYSRYFKDSERGEYFTRRGPAREQVGVGARPAPSWACTRSALQS